MDRIRSSHSDHQLDMRMLLLLTRRHKCNLVLNSSHQLHQESGLNRQNMRLIDMKSGNIGLHCYSDQNS